jgi:hypothetical protein
MRSDVTRSRIASRSGGRRGRDKEGGRSESEDIDKRDERGRRRKRESEERERKKVYAKKII